MVTQSKAQGHISHNSLHPVAAVVWCSVTGIRGEPCTSKVDSGADSAMCRNHLESGWKHVEAEIREIRESMQIEADNQGELKRPGVVYFIRVQQRIKIGTTICMISRMSALHPDEILHTMPGSYDLERRLHKQFHHLRITHEYFEPAPELLEFIQSLKDQQP